MMVYQMEAIICLDWEARYTECSASLDLEVREVFRQAGIQAGLVSHTTELLHNSSKRRSLLKRLLNYRQISMIA